MTFGEAIAAMKTGERVARAGWNGKGMSIHLEDWAWRGRSSFLDAPFEPCIVMRTAQGRLQPGWLASQSDILATDWELVRDI